MMYFVLYKEFNKDYPFPAMKDSFQEKAYAGQDVIVDFLKTHGNIDLAWSGIPKDVYTGQEIPRQSVIKSEGCFCWRDDLSYYVEKYNLRLPKEFEDYILKVMSDQ